ncbi:MAG: peptidylprolyl isomerase [Gammaproteobacteria bacterium]|nr:peptidylprolyl isomerase [Gammaproteobacteria bacterium]
MTITDKAVVAIHYTLKNDNGDKLDGSSDGEPLVYLHGCGNIIPGLEEALAGKNIGDNVNVTVPPEKAYGEKKEEMMGKVPLSAFEGMGELKSGMRFDAEGEDGHLQMVVIEEVGEKEITVNGNHPMAGMTLHFDVTIDSIRQATEEELSHGHVHTAGGCGHDH